MKKVMAREERLTEVLAPVFKAENGATPQAIDAWYRSVPQAVKESELLSPQARDFLKVLSEEGNPVAKLISLLSAQLGLDEKSDWEETRYNACKWRISRLKLEIEVFRLKGFFPLPEEKGARKQYLKEWLPVLLTDFNYQDNEKESILLDILEQVVW